MSGDSPKPHLAFYGHHKCGTAWLNRMLLEVCLRVGLNFRIVHRPVDWNSYGNLESLLHEESVDFLSFTNADKEHLPSTRPHRAFHVVRDPRDILVSAYFSHLHSHPTKGWPELEKHRRNLQRLSEEEGLLCEMDFSSDEFRQIADWNYDMEYCLELKFETIILDPYRKILSILEFLGLSDDRMTNKAITLGRVLACEANRLRNRGRRFMPNSIPLVPIPPLRVEKLPPQTLERIVAASAFAKMSKGRSPGTEDTRSHYRKGVAGDWKNHFSEQNIRLFKERFNDVLVKLEYETDRNWGV